MFDYFKSLDMLFQPDYVRPDHCDGIHGINRVAAVIESEFMESWKEHKEKHRQGIEDLRNRLSEVSVRPHRILIFKHRIIIEWYPNGHQVFMNRGQYAGFILEFAIFLGHLPIDDDVCILEEFFDDIPDFNVKNTSDEATNFFPEFNSECFGNGSGEPIEVLWRTEKV